MAADAVRISRTRGKRGTRGGLCRLRARRLLDQPLRARRKNVAAPGSRRARFFRPDRLGVAGAISDFPVRRPEAQRQAAALPAGAWRRCRLGRAVAAVLPRHCAARRGRACVARPPAHQPDLSESALTLYSGSMTTTELKADTDTGV